MQRQNRQKFRSIIFFHHRFKPFQVFGQQIHGTQILHSGRIGRPFFQESLQVSVQPVYHGQRILLRQHPPAKPQHRIILYSLVVIQIFTLRTGPIPVSERLFQNRYVFLRNRISAVDQVCLYQPFQHTGISVIHSADISFKSHLLGGSGRSHRKVDITQHAGYVFRLIPLDQ